METKIITVSLKSKEIQEATAPRSRKSHRREVVHLRMVACLVAAVALSLIHISEPTRRS